MLDRRSGHSVAKLCLGSDPLCQRVTMQRVGVRSCRDTVRALDIVQLFDEACTGLQHF